METLNVVDAAKLAGFLLVIVATIVATVKIPSIDKKISNTKEAIGKFRDSRILTGICKLAYGEDFTKRRIELFERNQMIMQGGDKKAIRELAKRALNDTAKLARQWAVLLSDDKESELLKSTNDSIDKILADETVPLLEKIDKVEKIWKENQSAASNRLKVAHEKYHKDKAVKENHEKARLFCTKLFAWLQISGLILFSGAEIIGKVVKWIGSIN